MSNYDSKLLFQKIVDSSPLLIYIYDLVDKKAIYSNRKLTEILGYTEQDVELMGKNIPQTILHPDDFMKLEEMQSKIKQLNDHEELVTVSQYRKANGTYGWFKNTRSVFSRNAHNEVNQELGIVQEVTEVIAIENKLQATEQRFKAIFNSTSDFNFFLDKHFNIITLNNAAMKYFQNYTGVKLLPGDNLISAMASDMKADAHAAMTLAMNGEMVDSVRDYTALNGERIWFRAKFFPVYDEVTKQITGVNVNTRDVSSVINSNISLEQQNAQLKEIARINSHEIRRPLSNIIGLAELLKHYEDALPDDVKSLLDLLKQSSDELDGVIKKIVVTATKA